MPEHILIACYEFPPNPGIGGRRWAKFAKYLAKNGYVVHVIKADNSGKEISNWSDDVIHENIHVYSLARLYPKVLEKHCNSILDKILHRFFYVLCTFFANGTIWDKAIFWKYSYLHLAKNLVKRHNIKNVIATGAPFRLLYYTSLLRRTYKDINIIADYRDPWINAVNYGMKTLNKRRLNYEKHIEKQTHLHSNYITSPAEDIVNELKCRYSESTNAKYRVLPHAYDKEDIENISKSVKLNRNKSDKITFIYAGTLYLGLQDTLLQLAEALHEIKLANKELYQQLSFEFYTPEFSLKKYFESKEIDIVSFFKPIDSIALFSKVANADFCLLFLANHNKDYKTTKFFEFITLRKPFLQLGKMGKVAEFITEHKLGYTINNSSITGDLMDILIKFKQDTMEFDNSYEIEAYSFDHIVGELENMFV